MVDDVIDIHGHFFPSSVLQAVAAGQAPGVALVEERLVFGGRVRTRPTMPALLDLAERRRWLAAEGVAVQLVAPEPETYGYSLDVDQGAAWCRLVNECMAEALAGASDLRGLAIVPLQSGAAAAAELRYAVQRLGLSGCMIHTDRPAGFDDSDLDAFWAAAMELKAPVILHPANPVGDARMERYYLATALGRTFETAIAAAHLLCGGVFDRFPDLAVILPHGGGALPYQLYRLDATARAKPELWVSRDLPSTYFKGLYFDSILSHPAPLRFLMEQVGPRQILLGSDFPFTIGNPQPVRALAEGGFAPDAAALVASGNARRLFHRAFR